MFERVLDIVLLCFVFLFFSFLLFSVSSPLSGFPFLFLLFFGWEGKNPSNRNSELEGILRMSLWKLHRKGVRNGDADFFVLSLGDPVDKGKHAKPPGVGNWRP